MRLETRRAALLWGVVLGVGFATGAGCMNGALHNYKARISGSDAGRFALVIEADRTAIEGSHFLVDTATGDVWRMDSSDGRTGAWIRLGDAPADAQDLEEDAAEEDA